MNTVGNKMIGVILAAGKGTRIYPFSEKLPKPILPVGNRPLLEHQVEIMKKYGISEILIVIGHLGYTIVDALGDGTAQGISIRYVEQTETLGMPSIYHDTPPPRRKSRSRPAQSKNDPCTVRPRCPAATRRSGVPFHPHLRLAWVRRPGGPTSSSMSCSATPRSVRSPGCARCSVQARCSL